MQKEYDSEEESSEKKPTISKKDLAKKIRREAYLRAKEFKKTDPRELARKALAKEQRKAVYQKAKERNQAFKKSKKAKADLSDKVVLAVDLESDERPLAPVIPINIRRQKRP